MVSIDQNIPSPVRFFSFSFGPAFSPIAHPRPDGMFILSPSDVFSMSPQFSGHFQSDSGMIDAAALAADAGSVEALSSAHSAVPSGTKGTASTTASAGSGSISSDATDAPHRPLSPPRPSAGAEHRGVTRTTSTDALPELAPPGGLLTPIRTRLTTTNGLTRAHSLGEGKFPRHGATASVGGGAGGGVGGGAGGGVGGGAGVGPPPRRSPSTTAGIDGGTAGSVDSDAQSTDSDMSPVHRLQSGGSPFAPARSVRRSAAAGGGLTRQRSRAQIGMELGLDQAGMSLTFIKSIGRGASGMVYLGQINKPGFRSKLVAVKQFVVRSVVERLWKRH